MENNNEWSFLTRNLIAFSDRKEIVEKSFSDTEYIYHKAAEWFKKYLLTTSSTLFVCDLPGEYGVALCSQLHQYADVIMHFNNVAHENEGIPLTRTLSALQFYSPVLLPITSGEKKTPIVVVERRRLNTLTNNKKLFNNKYMIELPTTDVLCNKGISSIVYIKPRKEDTILDDCMEYFKYYKSVINVFTVSVEEMSGSSNKGLNEIKNAIRNFDEYVS